MSNDNSQLVVAHLVNLENEQGITLPNGTNRIYIVLKRTFREIGRETYKQRSLLVNEAIVKITLNEDEAKEFGKNHPHFDLNFCPHCGGGLLEHENYHSERKSKCGEHTHMPMPPKLSRFLKRRGHKFRINPKKALREERKRLENFKRIVMLSTL